MCVKNCLAQAPTRRQPHPLLLKATPTKHATKPHPPNMPQSHTHQTCHKATPIKHIQCRHVLWVWPYFNDIHRFFSFSLLPTYPILSSGSPEKQLIELVWPYYTIIKYSRPSIIQTSQLSEPLIIRTTKLMIFIAFVVCIKYNLLLPLKTYHRRRKMFGLRG